MSFEELINAPGTLHVSVIALFAVCMLWIFFMFFQPKILHPYKDLIDDVLAILATIAAGLFIRKFGWKLNAVNIQ